MENKLFQMVYDYKTKSWTIQVDWKEYGKKCLSPNKIQSRESGKYYRAWANGYVNHSDSLQEMVEWVERICK